MHAIRQHQFGGYAELARAADAHHALESRATIGKVVLKP